MDDKELACLQAVGRAVDGMTERERLEFVGRLAMYVANVGRGAERARIDAMAAAAARGAPTGPFRCKRCGVVESETPSAKFVSCPKAIHPYVGHSWERDPVPEEDRAAVMGGYNAPIAGAPIEGSRRSPLRCVSCGVPEIGADVFCPARVSRRHRWTPASVNVDQVAEEDLKFESIAPPIGFRRKVL